MGGPFQCPPSVFHIDGAVYIRTTNVRDAARILQDITVKPQNWETKAISAEEINKVCSVPPPLTIHTDTIRQATHNTVLARENEGLHTILVCPIARLSDAQIQAKIRVHFKHYDFFAMVKQPASFIHGAMEWVVEWSDADATRSCASYLYNLGWVTVSLVVDFIYNLGTTNTSTGRGALLVSLGTVLPWHSDNRCAQ